MNYFQGAIIFHIIACIYIFIAIAILVDDYFIAALDKICAVCFEVCLFIYNKYV